MRLALAAPASPPPAASVTPKPPKLAAGSGSLFGGQNVDGTTVLVRYTLSGDANLDGTVDFLDLAKLAQSYNTSVASSSSTWYRGDFNYDGMVDFNDLAKLAQNYNTSLPATAIPGAPADFQADFARAWPASPNPQWRSSSEQRACAHEPGEAGAIRQVRSVPPCGGPSSRSYV